MASDHPKFEDDVSQFSGKMNEKFVDWVIDVKVLEAEHKDETQPRPESRLYRSGPLDYRSTISGSCLGRKTRKLHRGHHRDAQKQW